MAIKAKQVKQPTVPGWQTDRFNPLNATVGYSSLVGVRAVAESLIGRVTVKDATPELLISAAMRSVDVWHAAVEHMARETRLPEEERLRLLRCPPAGIRVAGNGFQIQTCRRFNLCPFCIARRAVSVWSQLDRLLFPTVVEGGTDTRPEKAAYEVVEHRRAVDLPRWYTDPAGGGQAIGFVAAARLRAGRWSSDSYPVGSRAREMRQLGRSPIAFVEQDLFDLAEDEEDADHRFLIRQLIVVPRGSYTPRYDCGGAYHETRHVGMSRGELANAVARIFCYPENLLFGSAADLRGIIGAKERARLFCATGALKASNLEEATSSTSSG